MTRKERLMAVLEGKEVDRPPVCFYELNGYDERPEDEDPFNIYNHPSWKPLIELTREKTDRIVMRSLPFPKEEAAIDRLTQSRVWLDEAGSRHEIIQIRAGDRVLRSHTRVDRDVNTVWTLEHLLKDEEDLAAWIALPHQEDTGEPDYRDILQTEQELGDTGIVMLDTGDALCEIASLFSMADFTVMAMMEQELFQEALEIAHRKLVRKIKRVSGDLPGRLWRIYGPEYATPPYLPPYLYRKYVVEYDSELTALIREHGGYARIHQHGNLKDVLDYVLETGCMGIDPIEPKPQGDVSLAYVKEKCKDRLVLFGNLEINDIEMLDEDEIEKKVKTALEEGFSDRKGFVLMPSASPYGRVLSEKTLRNYRRIIDVVEAFSQNLHK